MTSEWVNFAVVQYYAANRECTGLPCGRSGVRPSAGPTLFKTTGEKCAAFATTFANGKTFYPSWIGTITPRSRLTTPLFINSTHYSKRVGQSVPGVVVGPFQHVVGLAQVPQAQCEHGLQKCKDLYGNPDKKLKKIIK